MADYFEQQMKTIVKTVLESEIDFSIYTAEGRSADGVAGKVAAALRAENYVQSTGIGSRAEYERSTS